MLARLAGWSGPDAETPVEEAPLTKPKKLRLNQHFPNPFNSATTIAYDLPEANHVTLVAYAGTGQHAAMLVSRHQEAGHYKVAWDGREFASGIYFYRLEAGEFVATKRMLLLR